MIFVRTEFLDHHDQCCQDKINQILIQTVSFRLGDFTDEGIRLENDGNFVFEGEHHIGAKFQLHVLAVVAWILLTPMAETYLNG